MEQKSMDELIMQLGLDPSTVDRGTLREVGRRYYAEPIQGHRVKLDEPSSVARHFQARLGDSKQEHFVVIALDSRLHVIEDHIVCKGGLSEVHVRAREVFRSLISSSAYACILVHNHPSGDPEPSGDDIALTKRLAAAGEIVGIPVLDHLVAASGGYVSFRERGYIAA